MLLLGAVCSVAFLFGLMTALASELPQLDPANHDRVERNGYIYASDKKTILAVLRGDEARVVVKSDEITPLMKQAIVAVEDRRFWEHSGVDVKGIFRAVFQNFRNDEVIQGGSTITQQFVKNTYIKNEKTVSRKLKEAALAWQLERTWSKDRILTGYLNTVFFGNNAYGVEMASRVYFGKHATELGLAEAALLAGIPQNPSVYDPVRNPEAAKKRRDDVLRLMLEQQLITQKDYLDALRTRLPDPDSVKLPGTRGAAPYFAEYVKSQLISYYGSGKVYGGGLKVYTTIDLELQELAKKAIDKHLSNPNGPQAALVAINPSNGNVLAMVGGQNFSKSQFNLAVQGLRQSGSSFKPFVLATALDLGISPAQSFQSKPITIFTGDRYWPVTNYEGFYLGRADLRTATIYSDNSVYAQLTDLVGPQRVAEMAHRLGVKRELNGYFSIGLGAEAVSPLDMARAYATFANDGRRVDGAVLGDVPRVITSIEDPLRKRVDANAVVEKQVLRRNDARAVTAILQRVITQGTGKRAVLADGRPVAGKTGTTENYGDAWFVGYTPQLAVAVWVGYPDKLVPMTWQFGGDPVAGGTYPAQIFKAFVDSVDRQRGLPARSFPSPSFGPQTTFRIVERNGAWMRDNGRCTGVHSVYMVAARAPSKVAPCRKNEVSVPDVVGMKLTQAEARVAASPLQTDVISRPAEPGEKLGVVVDQFPKAGARRSSYDVVRLVIPKAVDGAVVPDVIGLPLDEARTKLERRALEPVVGGTGDGEAGVVVAQSPRANVAATPGMEITLTIGGISPDDGRSPLG